MKIYTKNQQYDKEVFPILNLRLTQVKILCCRFNIERHREDYSSFNIAEVIIAARFEEGISSIAFSEDINNRESWFFIKEEDTKLLLFAINKYKNFW